MTSTDKNHRSDVPSVHLLISRILKIGPSLILSKFLLVRT